MIDMKPHNQNLIILFFCIICISLIHVEFAYAEDHSIETHDSQSGIDIILKDQSLIVEKYATGFEWPTSFGFIENDMFVLEKNSGKIFLIKDESAEKELVLEIDVSKGKEEGLLGILTRDTTAYIHYTTRNSDDGATSNWFYRYHWDGQKFTEPKLLKEIHGGTEAHNSGPMILYSDGKVYGSLGDLDSRKGVLQNYLVGEPDYTSSIFALEENNSYHSIGIRNSFGLAVDHVTGNMWITENGPDSMDEINLAPPGFNSGWAKIMGPAKDYQINELPQREGFEYSDPEFSWEIPVSPTSISFITSDKFEQFHNSVLVGDFNTGTLYEFKLNKDRTGFIFEDEELLDLILNEDDFTNEIIFGTGFRGITSIQQGPDGLVYVLSIGDGTVYQIQPSKTTNVDDKNRCKQELKQGVNLPRCDLSNINLEGIDLSNADLSFTNLQNANLKNTNLRGAVISSSDLRGAVISDSDLSNTDFSMSTLEEIKMNNVKIENANLRSANFKSAEILETDFSFSDLDHIHFEDAIIKDSKMNDVNLNRGFLSNVKFENVQIKTSYIDHATFENAILANVDFSKSTIWVTDFSNADLSTTQLRETDNYDVKFLKSDLSGADFSKSKIGNSFFDGSDLSKANFLGTYPFKTTFDQVDFSDMTEIDSCLNHDIFSRIINKILRDIRNDEFSFLSFMESPLVKLCQYP